MKLENNFTIDAPVEKAWAALNSPETVAPCFPGATLTEYEGDSFTGTVKVKLGPIAMTYKGKGIYLSRDEAAHEVVIDANGKDSRGNGTAKATVTASLAADGPDRTTVAMVTDMTITGKPAQFGRGVISDVADKIIGQFAACVARKLAPVSAVSAAATSEVPAPTLATASTPVTAAPSSTPGPAEGTPLPSTNGVAAGNLAEDDPVTGTSEAGTSEAEAPPSTAMTPDVPSTPATAGTASTGTAAASSGGAPSVPATPIGTPAAVSASATTSATPAGTLAAVGAPAAPRAPVHSEVDAIDLLDTAGAPVLKRLAPVAGGAVLLLLVVLLVRRLRSR